MTALDRTAAIFRRHRRTWVSALRLMQVGGLLAWRTRVSDCRTLLGMRIEQRTERTPQGARSFYRYVGKARNGRLVRSA